MFVDFLRKHACCAGHWRRRYLSNACVTRKLRSPACSWRVTKTTNCPLIRRLLRWRRLTASFERSVRGVLLPTAACFPLLFWLTDHLTSLFSNSLPYFIVPVSYSLSLPTSIFIPLLCHVSDLINTTWLTWHIIWLIIISINNCPDWLGLTRKSFVIFFYGMAFGRRGVLGVQRYASLGPSEYESSNPQTTPEKVAITCKSSWAL